MLKSVSTYRPIFSEALNCLVSLRRISVLSGLLLIYGCGDQIENQFIPPDPTNPEYERKFSTLEKQVGNLNQTSQHHSDDFKLTHNTVLQCQEYLSILHENINQTREEHLPEWQQMFDALTNRDAMHNPEFVIGNPPFITNFYHQSSAIKGQAARLDAADAKLERVTEESRVQASTLGDHSARLSTLDGSIAHINATLQAKFEAIDKILDDYNGRIRAVEDRMVAVDTRVGVMESRVGAYDSRIRAVEQILTQYNIAGMDRRLRTSEATLTNHSGFITELQSSLGLAQGEMKSTRDDLRQTQQELTRSTNELRQLIRSYHPE
jgi:predicted  nucleic acid-binding Zn-ribbon protein